MEFEFLPGLPTQFGGNYETLPCNQKAKLGFSEGRVQPEDLADQASTLIFSSSATDSISTDRSFGQDFVIACGKKIIGSYGMTKMMSPPTPVLMLGARTYSEVLLDMFECLGDKIDFQAVVENRDNADCTGTCAGLPVIWHEELPRYVETHSLVCALGTTLRKDWIEECTAMGFSFEKLVHPSSTVSNRTTLADGVIIDAGSVVAGFSSMGPHSRLGRRVSLGHHTTIGAYTTVHPGAIISGNCIIGSQVILGTGTVVIDGVTIGDGAVTAAGTIVHKDVPPRVLAAGNRFQIKKTNYGPR